MGWIIPIWEKNTVISTFYHISIRRKANHYKGIRYISSFNSHYIPAYTGAPTALDPLNLFLIIPCYNLVNKYPCSQMSYSLALRSELSNIPYSIHVKGRVNNSHCGLLCSRHHVTCSTCNTSFNLHNYSMT